MEGARKWRVSGGGWNNASGLECAAIKGVFRLTVLSCVDFEVRLIRHPAIQKGQYSQFD